MYWCWKELKGPWTSHLSSMAPYRTLSQTIQINRPRGLHVSEKRCGRRRYHTGGLFSASRKTAPFWEWRASESLAPPGCHQQKQKCAQKRLVYKDAASIWGAASTFSAGEWSVILRPFSGWKIPDTNPPFYYEGYSIEEIGKILRLNPATVGTRLARGRALLKKWLETSIERTTFALLSKEFRAFLTQAEISVSPKPKNYLSI